jgi:UDP-3-O-acyl-N-acetylglucosamine deacetylase
LSDGNKLKSINKLVNQFTSSIKHKPFRNELDKARTLAFISALRNVLGGVRRTQTLPEVVTPKIAFDDQQDINREGLDALRNHMKGNDGEH